MRISKIKISASETKNVNLKEIDLTKKSLGSVVALVGKNGAGKSRILKFVESFFKEITPEKIFEEYITHVPNSFFENSGNFQFAKSLYEISKKPKVASTERQVNETRLNQNFESFKQNYNRKVPAYLKVVDNDDLKLIKDNIKDDLTFEEIISIDFENNKKKGFINEFLMFNNLSTINYITKLTNEIVAEEFNLYLKNKDNPLVIQENIVKNKSFQLFNKFQKYVKQFLGRDFSYVQVTEQNFIKSTLHLNGEPFKIDLLSPGQKMLFAYAILFFYLDTNTNANIKDCIIIIDEPEKHLHPEAQIKLVTALKNIIKNSGQLWIATHSVHILSHLDFDEILMVKDDEIIPPSRTTPGNSFNELMGLEDHIIELTSFINSISEWAYGNFMVQCFKDPDVIFGNNPNDPQFKLFKDFITEKNNLNLLDFGAGKGRIGYTIAEDPLVSNKINYSAYEPNKLNFDLLSRVPTLKNLHQLERDIPINSYDIVVMCNVLHEINPNEWIESLKLVKNILKEEGYLIIIEDRFLPKGETAHEFGYIILGSEETKILLNSPESINLKLEEKDLSDRIIFNAFTKNQINPTNISLKNSLIKLMDNTLINIKSLKKENKDLNQGRRLANETQLYINSKIYLDSLEKGGKKKLLLP